ncbi:MULTISPECIES: PEP-CTERM sorting domain-containing protein [unclassified Marinobacter]|uniref:PEP-CTERM sorting domain-containing protein n=1 Tax=unclassified Marinobacter TaxID=83889 RepID=UPI00200CF056|nr:MULTISPECIES: PEP-CTERM sorting domain-containing protein [unclassified Marinobacter]UQG56580.1 PEP-CTERM sorting domain-containing protein [Marinobacter sp. M4C]UQG65384.1 PEP-CTERM sorting domain-containing protein [Marinobacter sp. M2C]UQG69663.1 PEP-CTERM sorting domain-containing protein [Marinobacter sp. M1C]
MKKIISGLFLTGFMAGAQAGPIVTADYTELGGNRWQADYILSNPVGSPFDINYFTIDYVAEAYTNFTLINSVQGWDSFVAEAIPAFGFGGLFDAFALDNAAILAPGQSTGFFSVEFDYFGNDNLSGQQYSVLDPSSFESLASGAINQHSISVPEPSSLTLLVVGMGLVCWRRRLAQFACAKGVRR